MRTDADRTDLHEARRRITERWGAAARDTAWNERRCLEAPAAVAAVADAIEYEREVDADDVRAGLRLIPSARTSLDAAELDLIRRARQMRLTWDEIGALLGVGDRRAAQQRYARLRARFDTMLRELTAPADDPKETAG